MPDAAGTFFAALSRETARPQDDEGQIEAGSFIPIDRNCSRSALHLTKMDERVEVAGSDEETDQRLDLQKVVLRLFGGCALVRLVDRRGGRH